MKFVIATKETQGREETKRCFYQDVIPLAFTLLRDHGVPMYALGFTGSNAVLIG